MDRNSSPYIYQADLDNWLSDTEIVFARAGSKHISCYLSGVIIVVLNSQVIWSGTQSSKAVEIYNSIT